MTTGMATKGKDEKSERDVLGKLADRGEATLSRLVELPGGTKAVKAFNELRLRVDEMGKKVRGIDALEKRVAKLERDVAAVKRAQKAKPAAAKPRSRTSTSS